MQQQDLQNDFNQKVLESVSFKNIELAECVFFVVGNLLLLFCRFVLSDSRPTIFKEKTVSFKALKETTLKESHSNIAMNTNALQGTLVAIGFLIFSCILEFFKFVRIMSETPSNSAIFWLIGVLSFLVAISFWFNTLAEKVHFKAIVNNRVSDRYYLYMSVITVMITTYGFILFVLLSYMTTKRFPLQSYGQLLLSIGIFYMTHLLRNNLNLTDG